MKIISVNLDNVEFYGYHGVFEQERTVGNRFSVSLGVSYQLGSEFSEESEFSEKSEFSEGSVFSEFSEESRFYISYADLYEIVKEEMEKPRQLLETIAESIQERILERWPMAEKIEVRIAKLAPPIPGIDGTASVALTYMK